MAQQFKVLAALPENVTGYCITHELTTAAMICTEPAEDWTNEHSFYTKNFHAIDYSYCRIT